ncbi:putative glucosylceramidase 1 [Oppia nitens]|uniref:putative glucosylceramidase 1 n=1 Tax=Oppia nitens TaxID=1686743 RepID=UPI0023DA8C4C|nr:putative glucosylceramidase 1 [Oppia nitens]
MLSSVDPTLSRAIIESYYGSNGIEYTFGRIPIGGTDYSLRPYTLDDVYNDKQLKHFSLQKEDFEWKIPYVKLAQKVSPHNIKLFASNWCPPVWMKKTEEFISFTELKGDVSGEYFQILADYHIKFLNAYKENGIEFWGLTSQNEPVEDHELNNLKFTPNTLRDYIKNNLGPTLARAGYDKNKLKLLILDDNTPFLINWIDIILNDTNAAQYVSGIANHWYYNEKYGAQYVGGVLQYLHEKYENYFYMNTEACFLEGAGNGNWTYAERYAFDIINQLNNWAVGWVEWNMVLDLNGGPFWFERSGCGGLVYVDSVAGEAYKQPSFYALGHFSKFILPDSVRVEHQMDTCVDNIYVVTAKRHDGAVVVVVLNRGDTEITLNIKQRKQWLTNKIAAHSIQSYIWWL